MKQWSSRASVVVALVVSACSPGPRAAGGGPGPAGADASAILPGGDAGAGASAGRDAGDTTPPTFAGLASAVAIDASGVALAWSPATDAATPQGMIGYRVYSGLAPGGEVFARPLVTTPAGAAGALVQGLRAATTYYFVVRAVDAAGNEDANTVERSATTPDTTPPVFAGVQSVTAAGRGALAIAWNPAVDDGSPASAISYRIFQGTSAGGEDFSAPAATTAPGATQYTLAGLADGTTYYVVVRAVDASGNADGNFREKSARTLDTTPPAFAGAASATAVGTTITVGWPPATDNVDPSGAIVYDVYTATSAGGEDFATPSFTTAPGATSYSALHLPVSTTYYFVVRARDTSGNEDTNTVEVSATTAASADVTPPVFAGLATATAANDTTIDLSWAPATDDYTAQSDIVYDVYAASAAGAEEYTPAPAYTTAPGATSFSVTGLQPLQTSYFVVRARDQAGNEDTNTVEKSATTLADTVPPSFGGLTTAAAVGPTAIRLGWSPATDDVTPPSGITYRVYVGTAQGAEPPTPFATTLPGTTTFTVTGLSPRTQYWFFVRAVDAANNPDTSTPPVELSATTPADVTPPVFGGVDALSSTDPTTLTAGWQPATDDVTPQSGIVYLAYVATSSGAETSAPPVVTAPGATYATFTGLSPSTKYYVVVRAEDAAGNVDANANELSATTLADVTPPVFAGASSVGGATDSTLTVNFPQATDDVTPPSAIEYLVCVTATTGGCNGASFTTAATVTGGNLSWQATGLSPNTTYYFVVRAEDAAGNVDDDDVQVSGLTAPDTTPPAFPPGGPGLTAVAEGDASILLSWTAATDDVSAASQIVYDVFQATASGGELYSAPAYTTAAGATSYLVPQRYPPLLQPSTQYFFVVRARDMAGNEDANTSEAAATTLPDTTPPTFAGAASISPPASLTQLTVSWTAGTDDVTLPADLVYEVCWATDASCATSFAVDATTPPGATGATIGGLLADTTYYVVVRARDQAGNVDDNTVVVSQTTLADTSPPTAAGGAPFGGATGCSGATASSLTVDWTQAVDNYTPQASLEYLVCKTTASNGCGGAGGAFSATATVYGASSYQFTGLSPTTTYYFVVRVEDQAGNVDSNYNVVSGQTVVDTTPPTFAGLASAVDQTGRYADDEIVLSWSAASDDVSQASQIVYDIYQSTTSGGEATSGTPTYTTSAGATTFTAPATTTPGLAASTAYYFVVRARDQAGNLSAAPYVEKSATTAADTYAPAFAGITGLTAASTDGDSELTATWSAATDDTNAASQIRYEVCWNVHGSTTPCTTSFTAMATTAAGAASYTNAQQALSPGTSYDFVVRAVDASGNVDTNTASLTASTQKDTTAPTFGGATGVSNVTLTQIQVNWSAATDDATPSGSIVYDVCKSTSSGACASGWTTSGGATGVSGTSYLFTGLTDNTPYYFVVRARDASGNEDANTAQVTGTTSKDTTAPTWVTTTGVQSISSVTDTTVTLGWGLAQDNYSSQTNITFSVYDATGTGSINYTTPLVSGIAQSSGTSNSYPLTNLTPDTKYCFVVRASDQAGNQETNTTTLCATTGHYPAPAFTSGPTATPTASSIGLSWAASVTPSTTITYAVCYSTSSTACAGGTGTNVTLTPDTATAVTISNLTPAKTATTYYVTVTASDVDASTAKQITTATTADTTAPTVPGGLTIKTDVSNPLSVDFSWTASTDTGGSSQANIGYVLCANSCAVEYTIPAGGGAIVTSAFLGTQGTTTDGAALSSNTSYSFEIAAIDQAGNESAFTTAVSATTPVSFANDVNTPIFGDICNGCHSDGNVGPTPGPFTYSFVINDTTPTPVAYDGYTECAAGEHYIVANSPSSSLIYEKMDGPNVCSPGDAQMPFLGTPNPTNIATVLSWINEGAPDN